MKTEYRMLEKGEVIQEGDQVLVGENRWTKAWGMLGHEATGEDSRRPIALTSTPTVLAEQLKAEQPYASVDEISDDLKWLAQSISVFPESAEYLCKHSYSAKWKWETKENADYSMQDMSWGNRYEKAQWQCAKDLLEAERNDEYDISQHSAEEVIAASHKDAMKAQRELNDRYSHIINTASIASTAKDEPAPAEPEAWDGEGLPPVGVECEYRFSVRDHIANYRTVMICAHSPCGGFASFFSEGAKGWSDATNFRPIESPEQKAEREREEIIKEYQYSTLRSARFHITRDHEKLGAFYGWLIESGRVTKREAASDEQ